MDRGGDCVRLPEANARARNPIATGMVGEPAESSHLRLTGLRNFSLIRITGDIGFVIRTWLESVGRPHGAETRAHPGYAA